MVKAGSLAERIDAAILVDEVGIETGCYGPYRLKTLYQPLFASTPDGLTPCGVSGTTEAQRDGQTVSMHTFHSKVPSEDLEFVDCLGQVLHLRNHANIGVDDLMLFWDCDLRSFALADPQAPAGESILGCLEDVEIDPHLLICAISDLGEEDAARSLAMALHERGNRVAVRDFGMGEASIAQMKRLEPDVVRLESIFFQRITETGMAVRLLALLIDALKREGRQVLVTGIDKSEHLQVALDSGADLLQGRCLARPKIAGAVFDTTPLKADALLTGGEKVIPLFGDHSKAR